MARGSDEKDMPWEDAIMAVLQAAEGALHYTEIPERIAALKLRQKMGANPAANVSVILSRSLGD